MLENAHVAKKITRYCFDQHARFFFIQITKLITCFAWNLPK